MYLECLESVADLFPLAIPLIAVAGLVAARTASFERWRTLAESLFYGALITVALGTVRSMMDNEATWLLHTMTLGFMLIGATVTAIGGCGEAATE